MIDRLTRHPYSDARNTAVAALALWLGALALAASAGALGRMGPSLGAALLVFMSALAVAATTMDRRIGAWIASWPSVIRVSASGPARAVAASLAILVPLAIAFAAQAIARGAPLGVSAWLLAALPPAAGLAGALSLSCVRGSAPRRHPGRVPLPGPLAAPRASR